jgi:hypothetical protein
LSYFACDNAGEIALFADREHDDGYVVVTAQRHGGRIHHLQVLGQHRVVIDCIITLCLRVRFRIGIVDAIDAGALKQGVAPHLGGAQRGAAVGREIGAADTGGEDHDAALFQMPLGPPADHRLADRVHLDGGLDAGVDAKLLQRVLHRQRVHDRRQHAHVVRLGAVHALRRARHAAKDVAAADDEADLQPGILRRLDLGGELRDEIGVDAVLLVAHQHLTRELEKDALIAGRTHGISVTHGMVGGAL